VFAADPVTRPLLFVTRYILAWQRRPDITLHLMQGRDLKGGDCLRDAVFQNCEVFFLESGDVITGLGLWALYLRI
jgi:hypothetical protein